MNRIKSAAIAVSLIIALVLLVSFVAGSVLSSPASKSIGYLPHDLSGQSVEFRSESGSLLHGWLLSGQKGRGIVILMHGVRANRQTMLGRARFLSRAGYSVLLFDFQAHGESPGQHITFGHLESRDAQAAVRLVHERFPNEKVGVIGVSMGGAAALIATPPLNVDALAGC